MCVKLHKTLNPKAQEWRPTPQPPPPLQSHHFLPHLIFQHIAASPPPPPQQAVQVVAFTPTPPHKPHPYYYSHPFRGFHPHSAYTQRQPFYYVSFPADENLQKAVKTTRSICGGESKYVGSGSEMNLKEANESDKEKKVESPRGKSPKSPRVEVFKKGIRRVFPPRLQRAVRYCSVDKKPPPPPPPKQAWKPKKTIKPDSKVSGDGGASHSRPPICHSPPPYSADYFSHSSNTTVMIKNIPNQLRRDFMLKFLDDNCKVYSLEYDFLYLPMDFRKKDNLGYAFVNFTTADAAIEFKKILHNYKWKVVYTDGGPITSKKICEITWARIQGKEALIKRFQNTCFSCDKLDFLPVILDPPRNGSDLNPPPPVILGTLHRPALSKIH